MSRTLNYKEYARELAGEPPATQVPGTAVIPARVAFNRLPPPARLVCVHPPGEQLGKLVMLRGTPLVVGREPDRDVVVDEPSVSRTHARLEPRPAGVYRLTDLGSSNGTFVNGVRLQSGPVHNGDRVQFGNVVFLFLTGESL
ncbi:MAG TPA: FHA domain-containing protein [Urbifossiella sp.]|nr:FHA domain-containing protein [Urbifossiella sp.]